jgi:hypothetical protein
LGLDNYCVRRSIARVYHLARQVNAEFGLTSQEGIRLDSSLRAPISYFIHAMGFVVQMKIQSSPPPKSHDMVSLG